jgi:hypothetical protein
MSPNRLLLAGVMACAFLVAGCDSRKGAAPPSGSMTAGSAFPVPGGASAVPAAALTGTPAERVAALLPEGTMGLIYVPKVKELVDGIDRIAAAVTPQKSGRRTSKPFNLAQTLRGAGFDLADFDLDMPAAIAMTQPDGAQGPPGATAILPVRDGNAVASKLKQMSPRTIVEIVGNFVVVTDKGAPRRGAQSPAMSAQLPDGSVVIRLDVAALWKAYGGLATSSMQREFRQKGRAVPAVAVRSFVDTVSSVASAVTTCDLVFRLDGTAIEADTTVRFAKGKKVPALDVFSKSDLAALSRSVPGEGALSLAMSVDPAALWESVEPLATTWLGTAPAPAQKVFKQALASIAKSLESLSGGMAMTAGFQDGKPEWIGVAEVKDPAAYVKSMADMMSALRAEAGPMAITAPEERSVGGASVTTVRLHAPPEKPARTTKVTVVKREVPGKEIAAYHMVALETRVLFVVGGDDVLEKALKACNADAAAEPTPLAKAVAACGADTVCYFTMDLAAIAREATAMISRTTGTPPKRPVAAGAGPVPLTVVINRGEDELRCRTSVDLGKVSRVFGSK